MATFYRDGKNYMYCPQCGHEMREDARFCIYCGYINFDSEKNAFLKGYLKKKKKDVKFDLVKHGAGNGEMNATTTKVDPNKKTKLEIGYKIKSTIKDIIVLLIVVVGGYYGYNFIVDKQAEYIKDANEMVTYVKNNVNDCGNVYYFAFDDSVLRERNINIKSPYFGHEYFGYVLVVNNNGNKKYFIAMSDGTFGIREKNIDEIKNINVLPYFGSNIKEKETTKCNG